MAVFGRLRLRQLPYGKFRSRSGRHRSSTFSKVAARSLILRLPPLWRPDAHLTVRFFALNKLGCQAAKLSLLHPSSLWRCSNKKEDQNITSTPAPSLHLSRPTQLPNSDPTRTTTRSDDVERRAARTLQVGSSWRAAAPSRKPLCA